MKSDRVHRTLVVLSGVAAIACVAELLWLRSAQLTVTRPVVGALFLPWFAAAAANLAVWRVTLARGKPTSINQLGSAIFWIVSGVFGVAFLVLYGWLLFGTSSG